jgi:hypothetical protein
MDSIGKRLLEEINEFTSGAGDTKSIDRAISTAHELLENLYILRYKAYEAGLFTPVIDEFPEFDLAGVSEPTALDSGVDETPLHELFEPSEPEEQATETQMPSEEEQVGTEAFDLTNAPLEPTATIAEEGIQEGASDGHTVQNNIPMEPAASMDLTQLVSISYGKHEKIDKFNGNYSLKEKITFINELFKGSSDSFGSAVKQIDSYASIQELMPTLNYLSVTNEWGTANEDALKKFIEKVVAKYA